MKKPHIWAIIIVVIVLGIWYFKTSSTPKVAVSGEPIKIGLILPLTGSLAFIGEATKNGAELALAKVNANPNLKHKYELVIEDDAFDAKKTAGALNKLISIDKVNAVVSAGSGSGNVASPIAEKSKMPHIGLATDNNVANGDFNFIHWTRPQEEVDLMLSELVKRNLKKVGLVTVNQQGYKAITDDFVSKAGALGVTVVSNEIFNPGDKDYKSLISRSQKTNPEVYILNAFTPELEILATQMKNLGVKQPLTSIESFGLTDKPAIFEGLWFIDSAVPAGSFSVEYKAKYNKEVGPGSANAYDVVNLFVNAIESTGEGVPSGTAIEQSLAKTSNYTGAFGPLTVSKEGAFISIPSVKVIKDGKAVNAN